MKSIKVSAVGRNNAYKAEGVFDGKQLVVKKGSIIAGKHEEKISKPLVEMRTDNNIVSKNNVLLKDITFKSASTAANFVTGNISNGLRVWRTESGDILGKSIK